MAPRALNLSAALVITGLHFRSHRNPKHMRVTMRADASAYWDSIQSDIDAHLKQAVKIKPPLEVFQPMHHLVFSAPKSLTPALCVAACEAVGGGRSDAMDAAAALHLMHVASVTHENILVGNAAHHDSDIDPNIELLTGDGLVPLALELLGRSITNQATGDYIDRTVKVIVEITRAIGSQGVVDRQYTEFVLNQSKDDLLCHEKHLNEQSLKYKKGKFYACGAACGAILGGGNEEEIQKLRNCGLYLGMMNEILYNGGDKMKIQGETEWRNMVLNELRGFSELGHKCILGLMNSYSKGEKVFMI